MNAERLLAKYETIADAPNAIALLRRFILDLAVRGKLVPQNAADEPASELLTRVAKEKARLVKAGNIKNDKPLPPVGEDANFDVPTTWQWTRLGGVTSYIQRGKSPKYAASDGSPVVSQKCVQWRGLDLSVAKQVTVESLAGYEDIRFLRAGDLLWNSTGTGTIGRVVRLVDPPEKLVCDSHVTVVRCLGVDPEYIRSWLRSDHVYALIEDRAAGSTNQVELTGQMALNQVIPLPPLSEQRRIVAKVDELMGLCDRMEAARTAREETRDRLAAASFARLDAPDPESFQADACFVIDALQALTTRPDQIKALRQTILNLAMRGKLVPRDALNEHASELQAKLAAISSIENIQRGRGKRPVIAAGLIEKPPYQIPSNWVWARMGELGGTNIGLTYSPADVSDKGYPVLRSNNIQDGRIELSSLIRVRKRPKDTVMVQKGDMLICARNGSRALVGKAALIEELPEAMAFGAFMAVFRSPINDYLHLFISSPVFRQVIDEVNTTTINQITQSNLRSTLVPLPPLVEQHRIVAKVKELMMLCDRLEASLTAASNVRNNLLKALLAGALMPSIERELAAAE
jgi:type I restriction enzyme S subunit